MSWKQLCYANNLQPIGRAAFCYQLSTQCLVIDLSTVNGETFWRQNPMDQKKKRKKTFNVDDPIENLVKAWRGKFRIEYKYVVFAGQETAKCFEKRRKIKF